jgi:hypothetical protein
VVDVSSPLVTFTCDVMIDEELLHSTSTLHFRKRVQLEQDLGAHGFERVNVREAPTGQEENWSS